MFSAAQQHNDVDQQQTDEDEGEVDKQLLKVSLGLRIHFDLRRSADGCLGHVLNALHDDEKVDCDRLEEKRFVQTDVC